MSDVRAVRGSAEPAIEPAEKSGSVGLLLALSLALVAVAVAFAFIPRDKATPYVLLLLGALAMVGIFSLFAIAVGFFRVGQKTKNNDIARSFLDSMAEGAVISDADGRILYSNQAYADLTRAEQPEGLRGVERVFSSDAAASEKIYRLSQATREGRRAQEEIRMPSALGKVDGPPRWYRVRVRPLPSAQDSRIGSKALTVWQVADITRDRDEQETSFQELQQVVTFLDHAPAGFFSTDPKGRINYLNATLADWLGYDLAQFEAGALHLSDIVQGIGASLVTDTSSLGREAKTRIIDLDLVKRNGQSLPVRLLHRVPVAADGSVGDSRTLVLNRSPGEEAHESQRAAEVRFARFFNSTPIAIAAVDRDGRVGRTNATFARLFGDLVRKAGSASARLVDVLPESDRARLELAIKAAAEGKGTIPPVEAPLAFEGSKKRFARFFVSSVEQGEGEGEAAVIYALETTDQRELEQQFAQSQKMQAIGQLAGGIAHDFNNVLTAIIGFSDLLLANHRPSDPSFQDIMNIKQNANRAAALVRQLLAFSRRQTLRPEVMSLGDTLADLTMLLQRLLGEKIDLKVTHARDLWAVKADQSQLEQVIVNLAVNARDAMPKGGRLAVRTANVTAEETKAYETPGMPAADYVMVEVTDNGTGIPPDIMEKIFEPFFTTKPVGQGTGLGLSTVYGIVKQTGGFIYCDSTVGTGTTFRIFLPRFIEVVDPAKPEGAKAADVPAAVAQPQADLTGSAVIMLVEDEEAVRAFASRALASRGYTVHEASTGAEALEVMEEVGGEVDLVVSDVVMPEMDGPTLLGVLRAKRPDLKVIFVSGYAEEAFAKNLPEGQKFHFLPKPFSLKQLAEAVKEALAE
ncbi:MAG: PAS domain-containing protein [Hyphomicrobiaceae bacterium]|nr:PAS domain-containing protein [Hyphomicrobiaceae bacterium]